MNNAKVQAAFSFAAGRILDELYISIGDFPKAAVHDQANHLTVEYNPGNINLEFNIDGVSFNAYFERITGNFIVLHDTALELEVCKQALGLLMAYYATESKTLSEI